MAINISKYIENTASVGGNGGVATRQLIGRFFTENLLLPTSSNIEFSSASDVGDYFGTSSDEYKRAVFYFGFVSKTNTAPSLISFARWNSAAVGSRIYGKVGTYAVGDFTPVTTGDLTLTLDGDTEHLTGIDFSTAVSLADVASIMQTKIRANSGGGAAWTSATVTYDATRKSFDLASGATGAGTVAVVAGSTTDVASKLGWLTGAILSNGAAAQTIADVLTDSSEASNNFGSFTFIPSLTLDQVTDAAEWNLAQNVTYLYSVAVSVANATAWSTALASIGGTTMTLDPLSTEYPEQAPMMILAATNYERVNSTQNYMFQQFNLTPSVTNTTDSNSYDSIRVNYYGQTQTAGQLLSFYQRGVMFGTASNPLDQNVYANEIWLKDAITAALMTLLIALSKVSANTQGRSQVLAILQSVIDQAVNNGTISIGKPLTPTQKASIASYTGDPDAWQQVYNIGYWVDAEIVTFIEDDVTRYKIVYTLVYSKDDIVRKIEGSDILI